MRSPDPRPSLVQTCRVVVSMYTVHRGISTWGYVLLSVTISFSLLPNFMAKQFFPNDNTVLSYAPTSQLDLTEFLHYLFFFRWLWSFPPVSSLCTRLETAFVYMFNEPQHFHFLSWIHYTKMHRPHEPTFFHLALPQLPTKPLDVSA